MTRFLLAILLFASPDLIAQSLPGSGPCLTLSQRQRLADSLAVLPVVREAGQQYRQSADSYAGALFAQQQLTADARVQVDGWKGKARKRGLLNALLLAGLSGLGYFTLTH